MRPLVFLIGFSFSGKSEAGRQAAASLGWELLDTDEEIERRLGKTIAQIFQEEGEPYFRKLEKELLKEACAKDKLIIATGGGMVIDEENRKLMKENGLVILLEASPTTIYQRLTKDQRGPLRPLLKVEEPLKRIEALKSWRRPFYSTAHLTIHTDNLSVSQVAQEVAHYTRLWMLPPQAEVATSSGKCPVFIGEGISSSLGIKLLQVGLKGKAVVISDSTVLPLYKGIIQESLTRCGFPFFFYPVPSGEVSKSLEEAVQIYGFLAENRIERGDIVVALGGGMVGDLAGFVASTYLRGLPLVQIPTTLMAMVDSAIGGKTAVNLPAGKNLVGSFYQPKFILIDIAMLRSLPQRELNSGWAEVIKYGFIRDPKLVEMLEKETPRLKSLKKELIEEIVLRCVQIKAEVVSQDEREERGLRTILNFGHTIGHGLEAATDYKTFLHGEAVAVGMVAASRLGARIKLTPERVVSRLEELIKKFALPTSAPGIRPEKVLEAMELDKKTREGKVNWVLLKDIGQPIITQEVPLQQVKIVLEEIVR